MAVRIRYVDSVEPGWRKSQRIYDLEDGSMVRVYINEDEYRYKIKNEVTNDLLFDYKDGTKNLNVLKRFARRDLQSLGVQLESEKRKRGADN